MEKTVQNALFAKGGMRRVAFRFDIIRDGVKMRSIRASGSVAMDSTAQIMGSARIKTSEPVDIIKDRIRPVVMILRHNAGGAIPLETWTEIDRAGRPAEEWDAARLSWGDLDGDVANISPRDEWIEKPVGVYLPRTCTERIEPGVNTWEIEAYDGTVLLREDCATDRIYIASGTRYLDAVTSVMINAGANNVLVMDDSDTVIPVDREFDIGVSKLDIVNTLLAEINFRPVSCDEDGRYIIRRYREPSPSAVDFSYLDDSLSILRAESSSTVDLMGVPNVFIAVCDNPDLDQTFRAEWVNDSPESPVSTINRGRNVATYRPDMISSQAEIDEYVKRTAFEANQIYETVEISTAINPYHWANNIIVVRKGGLSGIFEETGWSFELRAGAEMKHTLRRLVIV
jgi:hypothetical protein